VAWGEGDSTALEHLIPLVYRELRDLARRRLRGERPGHSLQATDLVHEAFLRLIQQRDAGWQHRSQFLAVAATIMRRILVDRARRQRYQKRGGAAVHIPIDEVAIVSPAQPDEIVALDEALTKLEEFDRRKSAVVEMRYFGGLTTDEIAQHLDVSPITVKRDWSLARAWLHRHMSHDGPAQDKG
jgi:RNA polymerase sigma factor (TIGR02999 family)